MYALRKGRRSPQNATRISPWAKQVAVRLQYTEPGGLRSFTLSSTFYLQISTFWRADERTRTADLLQLRVIGQGLQGCAGDCKCCIFRGVSFLRLAECCTVLRSRWYQSGINKGIAASRSCSVVATRRRGPLASLH